MALHSSRLIVLEAVLQKVTQAAPVLKSLVEGFPSFEQLSHAIEHHASRCRNFVSKLRKTSAYLRVVGSATKVTGAVCAAAGVVSRAQLLRKLGSGVWKIGAKAKLGGLAGLVLTQFWNNGFQDTLSAYLENLSSLVADMTMFNTFLEELRLLIPTRLDIERLLPMLLLTLPQELFLYACRIIRLFISTDQSVTFDNFITTAVSVFTIPEGLPAQVVGEVTSLRIFDFCCFLPTSLQLLVMLIHVAKEVTCFLSNSSGLGAQNFVHVKAALNKLWLSSISLRQRFENMVP